MWQVYCLFLMQLLFHDRQIDKWLLLRQVIQGSDEIYEQNKSLSNHLYLQKFLIFLA